MRKMNASLNDKLVDIGENLANHLTMLRVEETGKSYR